MKRILVFWAAIFSVLVSYAESYENYDPYTTEGTEFYVTFMKNGGAQTAADVLQFFLYASTRYGEAKVTIYSAKSGEKISEFKCTNTTVGLDTIDDKKGFLENSNKKYDRVLRVTSDVPISLYASNYNNQSYGAFNVLPVEALSKEYVIQTYKSDTEENQFAIIATQDNTTIRITPSAPIRWGEESSTVDPQIITLDKGEAYQIFGKGPEDDLSGTIVCSDKSIAVFNGGQSSMSTSTVGTPDNVVEQILPTYMWGKEFIVSQSKIQDFNVVKITAMYDNTKIYINNQEYKTLNKTESYEFVISKPNISINEDFLENRPEIKKEVVYIKTTWPTNCCLYHTSTVLNLTQMTTPLYVLWRPSYDFHSPIRTKYKCNFFFNK